MDKYGKHENASENQETGFSSKTPETPPERVDPCLEKGISLQNKGLRPEAVALQFWGGGLRIWTPPLPTPPSPPSETYAPRMQGHPFQGCTDASLKPKPIGESNPQIQAQFRHILPYFPRIFRFILFPFYNK